MKNPAPLPVAHDPLLFTPGPLTTSLSVKHAMLHDAGSWHFEFNAKVCWIREQLLDVAGLSVSPDWEAILLQGSGTFGIEAVFATCVPPSGKVAVLANGAYGERAVQMLVHSQINHIALRTSEDTPCSPGDLESLLCRDRDITHVFVVHCETTSGILNPIQEIGAVARKHHAVFIVDAMSSFGGIPIDFEACGIDYLVSSANKCLEGVPGFCFVFARRSGLLACEGWARSLSLDLLAQLKGFEKNGQFRYTPPTHSLLAFEQALHELMIEGGVGGRGDRYRRNHETLIAGMSAIGLRSYLRPEVQSPIITSFHYPDNPAFNFADFYRRLAGRGFLIYPGKISQIDLFRIGTIGRIFEADIRSLIAAIADILDRPASVIGAIRAAKIK
ncbi:MAG TPA: 2-aminoethylphosphonate--pyruvate transaminase [Candidatus Paceibacterota bacterium]|nr:2-aminoethylphosphonate--pyruvate transaminase [Verrucomicrobiota bacterium]HRY51169.1 2-aminoethylphosphonate--pyruvate transaminase [Candidatus Paceibacterota bacterium]